MSLPDWVPHDEGEFTAFCEKWAWELSSTGSIEKYGWDSGRCAGVVGKINVFLIARGQYKAVNSTGNRKIKDNAKKEAVAAIRGFADTSVRFNNKMDAAAKAGLGVRLKSRNPGRVGVPWRQLAADIVYYGIHLIELRNIRPVEGEEDEGARRAEWGARIFWGIMGESDVRDRFRLADVPQSGSDLPHSVFTRRRNYRFDFEGESSRRVYFCLRYENGKGDEGPFGPMLTAIIP
jgi:hypothetical protein